MKTESLILGLFVALCSPLVSRAQSPQGSPAPGPRGRVAEEVKRDRQQAQPGPEHQALMKLAGDYVVRTKYYWVKGQPPQESEGTTRFSTILEGRFLVEEDHGRFIDQPSSGFRIFGYNNGSGQYEATWFYTMSTATLSMTGHSRDGGKTIEYAAPFEESPKRIKRLFVKIRNVGEDQFVIELSGELPDDPRVETTYTRKK